MVGGDFETASLLIAEVVAVKEATGMQIAPHGTIALAGLRGVEEEASQLIGRVVAEATAAGQGTAVQYAHWANTVLMNGLGRYEEALAAADRGDRAPLAGDLHRLVGAGRTDRGRDPDRERRAGRTGRSGGSASTPRRARATGRLGIFARCEALVLEGEDAERSYGEAIDRLGRTRLRPELARAHLLYGEWLRRREPARRRTSATESTRMSMFDSIGMVAFAERARHELLATGERVRKRSVETVDELTPQERHIAQLARDGLSNPEIGAQLFLSPRTIEWHLRKVFAKLEISSRRELSSALGGAGQAPVSA